MPVARGGGFDEQLPQPRDRRPARLQLQHGPNLLHLRIRPDSPGRFIQAVANLNRQAF